MLTIYIKDILEYWVKPFLVSIASSLVLVSLGVLLFDSKDGINIFKITSLIILDIIIFSYLLYEYKKGEVLKKSLGNPVIRWLIFTSSIIAIILFYFYQPFKYSSQIYELIIYICFLIIIFLYPFISSTNKIKSPRFAVGAITREKDKFKMKDSSKSFSEQIKLLKNPTNVIFLNGEMGYGKSSFTRMAVEYLLDEETEGKNKTLYTYISLTEIEGKSNFIKIFSERWNETLSDSYQKNAIPVASAATLESIFQIKGVNFPRILISKFSKLIINLLSQNTKNKYYYDNESKNNENYLNDSLFCGIDEIKEKRWCIVIDELERAPIEELLNLIQIIERFKNLHRLGSPVPIIFILCGDLGYINDRLFGFDAENWNVGIIKEFLSNSKNFDKTIVLPNLIENRAIQLKDDIEKIANSLDQRIDKNKIHFSLINSLITNDYIESEDAISIILGILIKKSPRNIYAIINNVEQYYQLYLNNLILSKIRVSDVIIIKYIEIIYPELISFLSKVIPYLLNDDAVDSTIINRMEYGLSLDSKDVNLETLIKQEINWVIPGGKIEEISLLLRIISPEIMKIVEKSNSYTENINSLNTFYRSENLYLYLTQKSTDIVKNDYLYLSLLVREHIIAQAEDKIKTFFNNINDIYLLNYPQYVINSNNQILLGIDVAIEISNRLSEGKYLIDRSKEREANDIEAARWTVAMFYDWTGADLNSLKRINEYKNNILSLLKSTKASVGSKLIILQKIYGVDGGSDSERYRKLRELILSWKEIKEIVPIIIKVAKENFKSGKVYNYESWVLNYIFAITEDLEQNKKIINNHIKNSKEARRFWWSTLEYKESWNDIESRFKRVSIVDYLDVRQLIIETPDDEIDDKYFYWKRHVDQLTNNNDYISSERYTLIKRLKEDGVI